MIKRILLASLIGIFLVSLSVQPVFATDAQLACSPTTTTLSVGQTVVTDIIMNPRGFDALGSTVVMTYTPSILDATSQTLAAVTDTTGWTAPTTKNVDSAVGKITLDYGSAQQAFSETATIGRVTFTGKAAGTSQVSFVYFKEYDDTTAGVAKVYGQKTTGTTTNILTDVVDCQYTVTGAGITVAPTVPGSTVAPSALPRTGTFETTVFLLGGGGMVFFIGIFLSKFALSRSRSSS